MNRSIVIIGPYLIHNFGDDLIGAIIAKFYLQNNCSVYIPNLGKSNCEWLGITHYSTIKKLLKSHKIDGVIIGGGGILGNSGNKSHNLYFLRSFKAALYSFYKKIPCVILGVGAGPINTKMGSILVKYTSKATKQIYVRDIESFTFLHEKLHINSNKINIGADLALLWPEYINMMSKPTLDKKYIGIQFDPQLLMKKMDPKKYNLFIKQLINFITVNKENIVFLSNNKNNSYITELIPGPIKILNYKNLIDFLPIFSILNCLISTHLHMAIAAYAAKVPTYSFYVNEKTLRFYKQIGHTDRCVPFEHVDENTIGSFGINVENSDWNSNDEIILQSLKEKANSSLIDSFKVICSMELN